MAYKIEVVSAENLGCVSDGDLLNPYVKVFYNLPTMREIGKTKAISKTNDPKFNEEFPFTLGHSDEICVEVWSHRLILRDIHVGSIVTKWTSFSPGEDFHLFIGNTKASVTLRIVNSSSQLVFNGAFKEISSKAVIVMGGIRPNSWMYFIINGQFAPYTEFPTVKRYDYDGNTVFTTTERNCVGCYIAGEQTRIIYDEIYQGRVRKANVAEFYKDGFISSKKVFPLNTVSSGLTAQFVGDVFGCRFSTFRSPEEFRSILVPSRAENPSLNVVDKYFGCSGYSVRYDWIGFKIHCIGGTMSVHPVLYNEAESMAIYCNENPSPYYKLDGDYFMIQPFAVCNFKLKLNCEFYGNNVGYAVDIECFENGTPVLSVPHRLMKTVSDTTMSVVDVGMENHVITVRYDCQPKTLFTFDNSLGIPRYSSDIKFPDEVEIKDFNDLNLSLISAYAKIPLKFTFMLGMSDKAKVNATGFDCSKLSSIPRECVERRGHVFSVDLSQAPRDIYAIKITATTRRPDKNHRRKRVEATVKMDDKIQLCSFRNSNWSNGVWKKKLIFMLMRENGCWRLHKEYLDVKRQLFKKSPRYIGIEHLRQLAKPYQQCEQGTTYVVNNDVLFITARSGTNPYMNLFAVVDGNRVDQVNYKLGAIRHFGSAQEQSGRFGNQAIRVTNEKPITFDLAVETVADDCVTVRVGPELEYRVATGDSARVVGTVSYGDSSWFFTAK